MSKITGLNTVVVGFGRTGRATAEFLIGQGANVTLTDAQQTPDMLEKAKSLERLGVRMELGGHVLETFTSADLIVMSPGVPATIEPVRLAREKGVPITGEIELASRFIKEPILAVTGTNGKTTTVTLLGEMMKNAGRKVYVGGNIGQPLIDHVMSGEPAELVVIEVSSFQLETAETLKPHVAVLLNVTPDHLDRYPSYDAYFQAKARLFANLDLLDFAIVNEDDPLAAGLKSGGLRLSFSQTKILTDGAFTTPVGICFKREGRTIGELPYEEIRLTGKHNLENVMAAGLAALAVGVPFESMTNTVRQFQGLPHRVELVAEINGVRYYDDSKGTNIGAVIKSLESFNDPIILIAGGRDKDSDFTLLRELVREKVRLLVLIGEAAEKLEQALKGAADIVRADDMEAAVEKAREAAQLGDVVLLSPACASFDMYQNYGQRGDDFAQQVRKASC